MNWADYAIAAVIAISVLVGLFRGLVAEVLSLAIWIGSVWVAWAFGPDVAAYFDHSIHTPQLRLVAGYGLCVVGVLIVGALVNMIFHRLVTRAGLTGPDRALGVMFGFARGVLLVALMVFLLGFTAVVREPWWRQSLLLPQFQGVAIAVGHYLPASTGRYLHPSPEMSDSLSRLKAGANAADLSGMRRLIDAQAATLRGQLPAPTLPAPATSSPATAPAAAPTHP